MAVKEVRQFAGMNTDTAPQLLPPGDYIDATDVRVGITEAGNDQFVETVLGNTSKFAELGFSLPTGTNKCVGRKNDKQNNRLIWLNYNSNGNHGIYCYNLNTNTIQTVMTTSVLNFQQAITIHSVDILNNILGWTDGFNRPASIDVNFALQGGYGGTIIQQMITQARIPPLLPIVCTPVTTTGTNYIQSLDSFQFIYRYVFFDGSKSVFSSVSYLVPTGYHNETIQYITLDMSGCELFTLPQLQNVVTFVEIASRDLYTLSFNQFARIPTSQFISGAGYSNLVAPGKLNYYDTESKTAIDNTDYLMPYSSVPLASNTMNYQDNRRFDAGCLEGYNQFSLVVGQNITSISQFELPASGGIPDITDCDLHINQRYLKPDSTYGWGLVWIDAYGYKSGVQTVPQLGFTNAPYRGDDAKANGIQFTLPFSNPANYPPWAKYFLLARTPNQSVEWFVQARANNILYCTGYDSSGNPQYIIANPGPGNSNLTDAETVELHVDISNLLQYGINIPYTFQNGDKISFLTTGGNGSTSSSQSSNPALIEQTASASLTHLPIKSQVGNLLKIDYSQAYSLNLNAIANDPSGYNDGSDSGGTIDGPIAFITVGDNGFIAFWGYINDGSYAYPNNPATNIAPTKSNLYGCAMGWRFNEHSTSYHENLVTICGDNGEIWMVTLQTIFSGNFNYVPPWVQITTGVTTAIRCITYDADYFNYSGKHCFWAVGDNGVILKIANPTAGDTTPANFIVTPYTNSSYGNLYSVDASETSTTTVVVCGANGFTANFTGTTFTPWTAITCNTLRSICIERQLGFPSYLAVGDAGTFLNNYSGTWNIIASGTASDLYCVKQCIQYDYKTNTYKGAVISGVFSKFVIVGEDSVYLEYNATTSALTNLSSYINVLGSSKSCVYQGSNVGSPLVVHNDTFVAGDKDTMYGLLEAASTTFIDLTTYSNGVILGNLSLYNILNWGAKFEIYTPLQAGGADIYYEYGDVFPVGVDYTFYKGKMDDGDTFLIKKDFQGVANSVTWAVKGDVIFSMQANNQNTTGQGIATPGTDSTGAATSTPASWDLDYGRPNVVLLYPETQELRSLIRYSDPYVQDSKINGLSSFQQLNYAIVPAGYGTIRKITAVEYVMLINCEQEVASAYINRQIFNQSSSDPSVTGLSDQVINNITPLTGGYGCSNPESVVEHMHMVYFYSNIRGMDCRYAANGVVPISDYKARIYFYNKTNQDLVYCNLYGGFDPRARERLLTFNYQFAYTQDTLDLITVGQTPLVEVYYNGYVFALNFGGSSVTPINTADNSTQPDITVGSQPQSGVINPLDGLLYVACAGSNQIYSINPTTFATSGTPINVTGSLPQLIIYYNNYLYVVNNQSATIDMIDANPANVSTYRTIVHTSPYLGGNILGLTVNPDANEMYTSSIFGNWIAVVNPANLNLITTIALPTSPVNAAARGTIYVSAVKRLYVCYHAISSIGVIDVNPSSGTRYDIISNITIPGAGAWGGILLNTIVWIAGGASNFLYGIDTTIGFGSLVVEQPVGMGPDDIIVDTNNNYLFITSSNDNIVTVYNPTTRAIVSNINVGFESAGIVFAPSNGKVYAAVEGQNKVAAIGGVITPDTIGFCEDTNRWEGRYSYIPEMYGWLENEMFTFLNGELWQHDTNTLAANYYGVQYKPTITTVCNQEPNKVKILQHLQVASNALWNATSITTPEGQNSELIGLRDYTTSYTPPQDFQLLEGMYCASVLRDKNTPNIPSGQLPLLSGDLMRSEYFKVLLECESTNQVVLKYLNFYYIYSRATNK